MGFLSTSMKSQLEETGPFESLNSISSFFYVLRHPKIFLCITEMKVNSYLLVRTLAIDIELRLTFFHPKNLLSADRSQERESLCVSLPSFGCEF